mgnify:CR=1 FL=1
MDDGGGEGGCTKSAKLVANFVVALDDEATFLALDCVFFGERSTTAVASGGEARGFLPIADVETIPEFEGRQQRLSGSGGVHGEPVACALTSLDETLVGFGLSKQVAVELALLLVMHLFTVVAMRFTDGLLVVGNQKRFVGRGVQQVGGETLHSSTAGFKVGLHCCGGHGKGKAAKFEREGGQVAAGRGALEKFWKEGVPEGCLDTGVGGGATFNNTLGELPLHLKGLLRAGKGGLGKARTGFGHAVDLARPLICFGLEPSVPVSIGADVATKEAVARHNVCGVDDAAKDGTGCLLAAWGDNEDAFPRVQVVAIDFALLHWMELPKGLPSIWSYFEMACQ